MPTRRSEMDEKGVRTLTTYYETLRREKADDSDSESADTGCSAEPSPSVRGRRQVSSYAAPRGQGRDILLAEAFNQWLAAPKEGKETCSG